MSDIQINLLKLANLTIPSNKSNLKQNFDVHTKYEAFYTGGHVQLSEDGQHLFCTYGSKVQVLDTSTGKTVDSVRKDNEGDDVTAFTIDRKGEILVISYRSGLLRQWQWKTETVTRTWKSIHSGPIRCMVFDPTSSLLATGGSDSTVKVWDLNKQYCTHNLKGATGVFTVVQFHSEVGQLQVFGAADDYKIHIWDLTTGRRVSILEGHFSAVTQLAFTANGKTLFSSGRDKVVLVWNLEKYNLEKTIPVYETLESVMLVPEGRLIPKLNVNTNDLHILTAGNKGVLKVWNVNTGTQVFTQENSLVSSNESETSVIAMASYNAALDVVMVVTHEHNILMYKLEDFSKHKQLIGYNDDILDVRFFGEGDTHLVVATNSPIIKVFELATYNCQLLTGHTDLVLSVDVFSSKPSCMISASKDNTVKFWSIIADTGEVSCLFTGWGHTHSVTAVSCSSLGNGFFVSGSEDTTLKVWNIPQKAPLVVANPSLIVRCTQRAHDKEINSVAIAPNDKLLVSGSQDKTAKVWRCDDLTLIGVVRGHRKGVWCVQFSPIDQVFATSSADGTVKIWALNNLSCVKTFEGHECSVMKLLFLSRGMQLLTGGSDGNVKLWNIKLNECTRTLDEHTDKVWAMAISKDENFVVTGSADSKIVLWKDVTEEEKEKQHMELESVLEKDQELSNLIQQKKWLKALSLAITLDRPFKALNVIKEILIQQNGDDILKTITRMRQDQIDALLKFASTWNTNSKHCTAAQLVVRSVLKMYTPETLMKFPTTRQLVEELLPYTERHMQRMNRLLQQASFVNYMWRTMKVASSDIKFNSRNENDKDMEVNEEIDKHVDDIDADQKTPDKSSPIFKGSAITTRDIIMASSDSESEEEIIEEDILKVSPVKKSPVSSKTETSKTNENSFTMSVEASSETNLTSDSESDDNTRDVLIKVSPIKSPLISKRQMSKTMQASKELEDKMDRIVTGSDNNDSDNQKDPMDLNYPIRRSVRNATRMEKKLGKDIGDSEETHIGRDDIAVEHKNKARHRAKKSPITKSSAKKAKGSSKVRNSESDNESDSEKTKDDDIVKISPVTKRPVRVTTRMEASRTQQISVQEASLKNITDEDSDNSAQELCKTLPVRVTRGRVEKQQRTPQKAILQQTARVIVEKLRGDRYEMVSAKETPPKRNSPNRKRPVKSSAKSLIVEDSNDDDVETQITPPKKNSPRLSSKRPVRTCVKKINDAKKRLTM